MQSEVKVISVKGGGGGGGT